LAGAAYLVKSKTDGKEYIAKKILLGQVSEKEREGAMLEVTSRLTEGQPA